MQAPLVPEISRAILSELCDVPAHHQKLYDVLKSQDRAYYHDFVFEFTLSDNLQHFKREITDQGHYFLATQISVQHDKPTAPPLVMIQDGKRQRQVFSSAADSSAALGPGAGPILSEGAFITWPFGELGLIDITTQRKAGAGITKITVIVTGWKIQKEF